ncbi:MAG TPA: hypothetical protein VGS41_00470, partial [Chthonomonadales bacterium]|nr:hypothetical protein [Chthonomonadales bacterium]
SATIRKEIGIIERTGSLYCEERARYTAERYGLLPIYQDLQNMAERLVLRIKLESNRTGIQATAEQLKLRFEESYRALASAVPATPGKLVFTPKEKDDRGNNSVDVAYDIALRDLGAAEGAFKGAESQEVARRLYVSIVNVWMDSVHLVDEMFREPSSFWDPVRGEDQERARAEADERDVAALEREAASYFTGILARSVVDQIAARELVPDLRAISAYSRPQLPLNLGDACYSQAANKSWQFLFHPDLDRAPEVRARITEMLPEMGILGTSGGAVEYGDLRRIMLLQELCAFPLSSLENLGRLEDQYRQRNAEGANPHSRADVKWMTVIKAPDDRANLERSVQLFLTAVGLEVIEFVGLGAQAPYEFVYTPGIGPSFRETFDCDLRRAALSLHLKGALEASVRRQVEERITAMGVEEAVKKLKRFIEESGAPENAAARREFNAPQPLEVSSRQISSADLFGAVDAYLADNVAGAYQKLREVLTNMDITAYRFLEEGQDFPDGSAVAITGYYCT